MSQILILSTDYFAYKTTTKVMIQTKATNRAPTTTFCARYIDLIDAAKLMVEKNISIMTRGSPGSKGKTLHDIHYKQSGKLTLRDIFNYTPNTSNLMTRCTIREEGNFRSVGKSNLTQCEDSFTISKFYMQSFMCYNFRPKQCIGSFTINEIAHSYNHEMVIYTIFLPVMMARSPVLFIMLGPERIPYLSRAYGSYHRRMSQENALKNTTDDFMVQNKVISVELLPVPYDSRCIKDLEYSGMSKCLIMKLKEKGINRVPNTEIIVDPHDLSHVLYSDEENTTVRRLIDSCYLACKPIAEQESCSYSFAETTVTIVKKTDSGKDIRLRIMGSKAPNVRTTYHPRYRVTEFLLYAMSLAGIWLGISVVHLNPLLALYYLCGNSNKRKKRGNRQEIRDMFRQGFIATNNFGQTRWKV